MIIIHTIVSAYYSSCYLPASWAIWSLRVYLRSYNPLLKIKIPIVSTPFVNVSQHIIYAKFIGFLSCHIMQDVRNPMIQPCYFIQVPAAWVSISLTFHSTSCRKLPFSFSRKSKVLTCKLI